MNNKAGSEIIVNLDSHLPKKICGICLIENPLNMMKNVFYFGLKALFVAKIFQFLFVTTFWSYRKNGLVRKIRLTSKLMTSEPGL